MRSDFKNEKFICLEKSLDRLFANLQNNVSCPLTRLTNEKNVWHSTDGAGCIFLRISNRVLWQSHYILRFVKLKRSLVHRYWIIQYLRAKLLFQTRDSREVRFVKAPYKRF